MLFAVGGCEHWLWLLEHVVGFGNCVSGSMPLGWRCAYANGSSVWSTIHCRGVAHYLVVQFEARALVIIVVAVVELVLEEAGGVLVSAGGCEY